MAAYFCALTVDCCRKQITKNFGLTIGHEGPYFRDGERIIDMVLVFQCKRTRSGTKDVESQEIGKRFIKELVTNGLEIEIETVQHLVRNFLFPKLNCAAQLYRKENCRMRSKGGRRAD